VTLDGCTFSKPYSSATDYFLLPNAFNVGSAYQIEPGFRNYVNNCTFTTTTSGATSGFISASNGGAPTIINGGSTNCTVGNQGIFLQYNSTVIFNNFSCSNWAANFTTVNNGTGYAPSFVGTISTGKDCAVKFQRFNQVEADHRTYTGQAMMFSDSTIYDSSPRSLKIYSTNPSAGVWGQPIRIPLRKNQSAVLSVKMKPSDNTGLAYVYNQLQNAFLGRVPSLFIKANPALGANYNSDIEYFNGSQLNGATSPSNFVPTNLGANLKLWLDCTNVSDITYDSTKYTISQWNDKSGNNNHVTQSIENKKPILKTDFQVNGVYPVGLTGKKDQRLFINSNILGTTTSEMEVFVVGCYKENYSDNAVSYPEIFGFNGSSYMNGSIGQAGSQSYMSAFSSSTGTAANFVGAQNPAEQRLPDSLLAVCHLRNSVANSQRRIFINGTRGGSANNPFGQDATPVNITPTGFSIGVGNESDGSTIKRSSSYDVYEVIVVNRRMTDAEVDNMNKYLCNKWSIALRQDTTTWQTLTYTIPAPTDDVVVEAVLKVRGGAYSNFPVGWINIDTITVV
jgi:hypothetical protein